jgi:hypothetical protein
VDNIPPPGEKLGSRGGIREGRGRREEGEKRREERREGGNGMEGRRGKESKRGGRGEREEGGREGKGTEGRGRLGQEAGRRKEASVPPNLVICETPIRYQSSGDSTCSLFDKKSKNFRTSF